MLITLSQLVIGSVDLVAAFLLMFGLWRMASPVTAPSGILVAGIGMVAAILVSFLYVFTVGAAAKPHLPVNIGLAAVALLLGTGIAWWNGRRVAVTAMPQAVALFNGMGGGAAAAIAAVELFGVETHAATQLSVTLLGALIGSISLSGSIIAWAKLDRLLEKPLHVPGLQVFNGGLLLLAVALGGYIVFVATGAGKPLLPMPELVEMFLGLSLLYGIMMTLPIGGADMPVDFRVQRVHGSGGGTGRLRVAESGAHDRRHAGRRRGSAVDDADGPRNEPLHCQDFVRELRAGEEDQTGRDQRQSQTRAGERCRHFHAVCEIRAHLSRLWPCGLSRPGQAL
jgi:hypothetical protein